MKLLNPIVRRQLWRALWPLAVYALLTPAYFAMRGLPPHVLAGSFLLAALLHIGVAASEEVTSDACGRPMPYEEGGLSALGIAYLPFALAAVEIILGIALMVA